MTRNTTYFDQDVSELFDSLQNNILRQYLLILLQIQQKGTNHKVLNIIRETLEDIVEPLKIFRNSPLADNLFSVLEPLYDDYRYYKLLIHDDDSSNLIKRIKYAIYWLANKFNFTNQDGELVFSHKDIQCLNSLHISLEKALKILAEFYDKLDFILESSLWTSESIPDNILIQLNEVSKKLLGLVATSPELMHELSPRKFEELIARLLEEDGFDVQLTSKTRDGGRDIFASLNLPVGKILTLVECKKWSQNRKVSVQPVRSLYGILSQERATNAMLVTTSDFTKPAIDFVKSIQYQMSLKNYNDLKSWLNRYK